MSQPRSTQRILECLNEGRCVLEQGAAGVEGPATVSMTRGQLMDLQTRGFYFGELGGNRLVMLGNDGPQDENPEGAVAGA